jgi:hypothetical protein
MLKCFAVDHQARNDNHHVLQAIADEAGVSFEQDSSGRSFLAIPSCPDKKNVVETRLQFEELPFKELTRIAY